jgi:hypothetical protein
MDDRTFRKHLAGLVHGHHHPEEHDWTTDVASPVPRSSKRANEKSKRVTRKAKAKAK